VIFQPAQSTNVSVVPGIVRLFGRSAVLMAIITTWLKETEDQSHDVLAEEKYIVIVK